jgi:hypothetical protein
MRWDYIISNGLTVEHTLCDYVIFYPFVIRILQSYIYNIVGLWVKVTYFDDFGKKKERKGSWGHDLFPLSGRTTIFFTILDNISK